MYKRTKYVSPDVFKICDFLLLLNLHFGRIQQNNMSQRIHTYVVKTHENALEIYEHVRQMMKSCKNVCVWWFVTHCEKLEIHRIPFQIVNSVIRYRHTVRRERIIELGQLGLNQAQIAQETGYSLSTVKREIYAIREGLVWRNILHKNKKLIG